MSKKRSNRSNQVPSSQHNQITTSATKSRTVTTSESHKAPKPNKKGTSHRHASPEAAQPEDERTNSRVTRQSRKNLNTVDSDTHNSEKSTNNVARKRAGTVSVEVTEAPRLKKPKANTRCPPAPILNADDDEKSCDSNDDKHGEFGEQPDSENEECSTSVKDVDDLVSMGHAKLKATLASERPAWAQTHWQPATEMDWEATPNTLKHGDKSNINQHCGPSSPQAPSTSAHSGYCGSSEAVSESGSAGSESGSELEQDSKHSIRHRQPLKYTKHAQARLQEVPKFKKAKQVKYEINSDNADGDPNYGWPVTAHYTLPDRHGYVISLMKQPPPLKRVIQRAIDTVVADMIFKSAYPPVKTQNEMLVMTLLECAKEEKEQDLVHRIKHDQTFASEISRVLAQRMVNLRSTAKKSIGPTVANIYGLLSLKAPDIKSRVAAHVSKVDYIYPRDAADRTIRNKPFHHPAILSGLRDSCFGTKNQTVFEKYADNFPVGPSGVEVPIPLVSLVATVIHSSLDEWTTGTFVKSTFDAEKYDNIYKGHVEFLECQEKDSPARFHALMAGIYQEVIPRQVHGSNAIASKAMALLDWDYVAPSED